MNSALYFGRVRHRRFGRPAHEFSYSVGFLYLDLDELEHVFDRRWLWSVEGFTPYSFSRAGHLGAKSNSLAAEVREFVRARTGRAANGPIRLLTQARVLGFVFNPVSFYYLFETSGERVETIVAEINNTPWNEQHCYVLKGADAVEAGEIQRFRLTKEFHISPFFGMDVEYDWRFGTPGDDLSVHMESLSGGERVFDATLTADRRPLDGPNLARFVARSPAMSATALAAIYWQALRLRLRGATFHPRPKSILESESAGGAKNRK